MMMNETIYFLIIFFSEASSSFKVKEMEMFVH